MASKTLDWLRRRPLVGIAGSLALHLVLVGSLVWVKPPSSDLKIKRGEPLFIELSEADEQAQRGPAGDPQAAQAAPKPPAVAARPAKPPVVAGPASPARTEGDLKDKRVVPERPTPPERRAPPEAPEPPKVASAPPIPTPDAPEPAPSRPAVIPPDRPAVAEAPTPAEPAKEGARDGAGAAGGPKVAAVPDVRSALGRGGPGGAGGRGQGRAGIEGEPIPLDSKDPKYNEYLDRIRRMIKAKWVYPCVKNDAIGRCEYKSAQLVIEFGILKEGRVPFVTVLKQSDFDIYDEYAVNAIKLASPFPPVPSAMLAAAKPGSAGISITAHFIYVLESSLTNLLR
ncbi:MAG: TonB family protein [Candidatus Rokubacteria bacterium]|nr:TonB family protein [Candidatus Rokubacteria bacterium]